MTLFVSCLAIVKMIYHHVLMRTTLTIDDDIADYLKERARLLNKSFKQVVNDTLRRGMSPFCDEMAPSAFRVVPSSSGLTTNVDPLKLNQFNDELEAEDNVSRIHKPS